MCRDIEGKPEPPSDIQVLNITYDSIILSWVPGFDGGLEQKYRVRYHIPSSGTKGFMYTDAQSPPFTLQGTSSRHTNPN